MESSSFCNAYVFFIHLKIQCSTPGKKRSIAGVAISIISEVEIWIVTQYLFRIEKPIRDFFIRIRTLLIHDKVVFSPLSKTKHVAPDDGICIQIKKPFKRAFPQHGHLGMAPAPAVLAQPGIAQFIVGHDRYTRNAGGGGKNARVAINKQADRHIAQKVANAVYTGLGVMGIGCAAGDYNAKFIHSSSLYVAG